MSSGRTAAVVGLAVVLTVVLGAGNAVFAAHATVLDPGFVNDALEAEDGYDAFTEEMRRAVANATSETDLNGTGYGDIVEGDPIQEAVTTEYTRSQVEPNLETFFAYLHGNRERLNLTLDTRPLADAAGENVADAVRNATVSELVHAAPGDPFADVPVEDGFVRKLTESRASYRRAKADLRERIEKRVLDRMVDEAFRDASNDELLALVIPDYDPTAYTPAEKKRMVADRESAIRTALRQRIAEERAADIDSTVQDELAAYRRQAAEDPLTAEAVGNAAIATAANDLRMAVVTAATTDQSYESYRRNVTAARADLAAAVGNYTQTRITEEAGVVDLNEQLNVSATDSFEGPRTIVGYLDLAAIVLPVLALLLIGGVWFASRSAVTTPLATGVSLLVATVPAAVAAPIAGDKLRAAIQIEGESAETLGPVVTGIVDRVVGTATTQSLLLALLGLLLVGVAAALHYDVDDRVRERWGDVRGGAAESEQAGDSATESPDEDSTDRS